jgi:hypothetical protein
MLPIFFSTRTLYTMSTPAPVEAESDYMEISCESSSEYDSSSDSESESDVCYNNSTDSFMPPTPPLIRQERIVRHAILENSRTHIEGLSSCSSDYSSDSDVSVISVSDDN